MPANPRAHCSFELAMGVRAPHEDKPAQQHAVDEWPRVGTERVQSIAEPPLAKRATTLTGQAFKAHLSSLARAPPVLEPAAPGPAAQALRSKADGNSRPPTGPRVISDQAPAHKMDERPRPVQCRLWRAAERGLLGDGRRPWHVRHSRPWAVGKPTCAHPQDTPHVGKHHVPSARTLRAACPC